MHDTNARMQKREEAEDNDGGQGDPKVETNIGAANVVFYLAAGTSSAREPTRTAASTWLASRRIGEVESITRLVQTLRPT